MAIDSIETKCSSSTPKRTVTCSPVHALADHPLPSPHSAQQAAIPKQYLKLKGQEIATYSMQTFAAMPQVRLQAGGPLAQAGGELTVARQCALGLLSLLYRLFVLLFHCCPVQVCEIVVVCEEDWRCVPVAALRCCTALLTLLLPLPLARCTAVVASTAVHSRFLTALPAFPPSLASFYPRPALLHPC